MKRNNQKGLEESEYGVNNVLDIKLSYSRLSDYDVNGPKTLVKRSEVKGEGVDMGGLIDTLLFSGDEMDKRYYVTDSTKPTATEAKLVDYIVENCRQIPSTEEVLGIIKAQGYWKSTKEVDTIIAKFDNENFWEYISSQLAAKEKKLITTEQLVQAEEVVNVLRSHQYSKALIAYPEDHESKYAQYGFEFQYKNAILRGFMDLLVVNHATKTMQCIDLKTGSKPAEQFMNSFIKYRYYFQEAVYQQAMEHIRKVMKLEKYDILPFKFLYISRFERIPLVYTVGDKWHNAALKGFTTSTNYRYRGLDEVIDDVTWHWIKQEFSLSKEAYEQKGSLTLKDDFITVDE